MERKIIVNGQEYASVEAMPPEARRLYEQTSHLLADRDGDGIPDIAQGGGTPSESTTVVTTQFVVDGRAYASLADLPPAARARYEAAMRRLDADGNGVPDLLEAGPTPASSGVPSRPATPSPSPSPATRFESTGHRLWLGGLVVLLILLVVMAIWYGGPLLGR